MQQFLDSSNHIDMPLFDPNELLKCVRELALIDKSWMPNLEDPGQLFMRMSHISTDGIMGVKTPSNTKIFAILNPTTLKHKTLRVKCSQD